MIFSIEFDSRRKFSRQKAANILSLEGEKKKKKKKIYVEKGSTINICHFGHDFFFVELYEDTLSRARNRFIV